MRQWRLSVLVGLGLFGVCVQATPLLVPSNDNSLFYYKIGGGRDFSYPAVKNRDRIYLKGKAELGTGYYCGMFDPAISLQETFNDLYNSLSNVKNQLATNITSMVGHSPYYLLARANPTMYQILTGQTFEANTKIEVASKSCRQIMHETAKGQNPYMDWGHIAIGDTWKHSINFGPDNITAADSYVESTAFNRGIPWVQGNQSRSNGQTLAGGSNQPPIQVVSDITMAGYNVLLGRSTDDTSTPNQTDENAYLLSIWENPKAAADWVTVVLGDVTVTLCAEPQCEKSTTAGRGLLPFIHVCNRSSSEWCAETIAEHMTELVIGDLPITKENLLAVSSQGHVFTESVVKSLRLMPAVDRTIAIEKLAQEMAALHVLSQADLARRLLIAGMQVPEVAANAPAQEIILNALSQLNQEIAALSQDLTLRRELGAGTMGMLLEQYDQSLSHSLINPETVTNPMPLMQKGAIIIDEDRVL